MNSKPIKSACGIVPPLVTPLTDHLQLDIEGLERLIEHVLAGGVHGLFVLGTTGEGPSLSYGVRRDVIRQTCRIVDGRTPVFAGITDTVLQESIALAQFAADAGCDFAVTTPPFYFPIEQSELLAYFKQLLFEIPLPTMLYNMPAVGGMTIAPETVRQLLDQQNLAGLKDSSGDLDYFRSILEVSSLRQDFSVLVGPEHLLAETLAMGGDGGVSGGANIWPGLFVGLYEIVIADKQSDITPLASVVELLGKIYQVGPVSIPATIARIKGALSLCQICGDTTAPPIFSTIEAERDRIEEILLQLGGVSPLPHLKFPKLRDSAYEAAQPTPFGRGSGPGS